MPGMPENHLLALKERECRCCRVLSDIVWPLPVHEEAEISTA
jgi:hypothetical protein